MFLQFQILTAKSYKQAKQIPLKYIYMAVLILGLVLPIQLERCGVKPVLWAITNHSYRAVNFIVEGTK